MTTQTQDFTLENDAVNVPEITLDGEMRESDLVSPTLSIPDFDAEALASLDKMQRGINFVPSYVKFKKEGQTIRAVYMGKIELDVRNKGGEGYKKLTTAVFLNKDGVFFNSGVNLLNSLEIIKPNTKIEIEYLGEESTSSGNDVKVFAVYQLIKKAQTAQAATPSKPKPKTKA